MVARHAVVVLTLLLSFSPALAEDLDAEAARRFIVGKLFAFTCADGSRGVARVYDDGSVIGTIQFHGSEQPPPGMAAGGNAQAHYHRRDSLRFTQSYRAVLCS